MAFTNQRSYDRKVFRTGQLSSALASLTQKLGDGQDSLVSISRRLADGTRVDEDTTVIGTTTICDLFRDDTTVHVRVGKRGGVTERLRATLLTVDDVLVVSLEGEDANDLHIAFQTLQEALELSAYSGRRQGLIGDVNQLLDRVAVLESTAAHRDRELSFFLSYRFDGAIAEQYGREVEQFLTRLGVNVVTGKAYEPRRISDKVKRRIHPGVDALVVIVDSAAASDFCRDELTRAGTFEVPLIVMKEKGATFDAGIHADLEYIEFERGHVGDGFIKILEGVVFLRQQRIEQAAVRAQKDDS